MTERVISLPMTDYDLLIEERLDKLNGRVRHCFRSAYRHLRQSWSLHHVDNEMSAFRAITAEEEAATGLIHSLKLRGYPGADQLNHHNHGHKMAIYSLIASVSHLLSGIPLPNATLQIQKEGMPRVMLSLNITNYIGASEPLFAQPDNPLNFILGSEGNDGESSNIFAEKLRLIYTGAGFEKFEKYLSKEANRRNTLIYAADEGIPNVAFEDSFIIERMKRVNIIGVVTIAILQDETQQLLPKQCIETFLGAMPRLKPIDENLTIAAYQQTWTAGASIKLE